MDEDTTEERIKRIRDRTLASIRKLRSVELSLLEAEVLDSLVDGRKTAVELVEGIYGLGKKDAGFDSSCVKVRRVLRRLERRGLASTRMFGRDRPYRVTRYGIAVLASIAPDMDPPKILHLGEATMLILTAIFGIAMLVYSKGALGNTDRAYAVPVLASFFTMFGCSLSVMVHVLRRVV